ncbi:hypothetical protein [Myxococcus landrumensis]|uniref:Lipoprotein n=1 Tax=Myxococcus landrumensis TaxID=2813577 RepID=A0ABX7N3N4_9BACT|nr:hypothetical protein [Myxococcus landrumus]QSQ12016.1 hypothetical protein JY572_26995 [Myxococcus landrumus]
MLVPSRDLRGGFMLFLLRAALCGLLGLSASAWAQSPECAEHESPRQGPVTDVGLMAPETQVDQAFFQRVTLMGTEPASREATSPESIDSVDDADVMKQRHSSFLTLRFTSAGTVTP